MIPALVVITIVTITGRDLQIGPLETKRFLRVYVHMVKWERYLLFYETTGVLEEKIKLFNDYCNYRCYHEALRNVTPFDVNLGRHFNVLQRRREAKSRTIKARMDYDGTIRRHAFGH